MPRRKKKEVVQKWSAEPVILNEDDVERLLECLDREEDERMEEDSYARRAIDEVQRWLGFYHGAKKAQDNAPRSADRRDELTDILKLTDALSEGLAGLHPWMVADVDYKGADVEGLLSRLDTLKKTANAVVQANSSKPAQGRVRHAALHVLIGKLRMIFRRFGKTSEQSGVRAKSGGVEALSKAECDEVEFISLSLDAAGISYSKPVRHYFAQPGAALITERAERLEELSEKFHAKDQGVESQEDDSS